MVLAGKDLLAAAQTGTGKTAGFTLPLLHILNKKGAGRNVRCLILVPTRELAAQVQESVRVYGKYKPLRSITIFGGVNINPQIQDLRRGVDIVVATPGRLLDHVQQKTIDLRHVEILVLDEADRMLDMGFIHDIRRIIDLLPKQRQNLMFSATFPEEIRKLAGTFMQHPQLVEVARRNTPAELVAQVQHPVDQSRKKDLLAHLVKENNWQQVLVFTKTKRGANRLAEALEKSGIEADAIHGNKSQPQRTRVLKRFKDNELQVLVATDIAARGIDIDELPHVVNFDLPHVAEDYVHRIGRTGRAGSSGEAVSLVSFDDRPLMTAIERLMTRQVEQRVIAGFEPGNPLHQQPRASDKRQPPTAARAPPAAAPAPAAATTSAAPRATATRPSRVRTAAAATPAPDAGHARPVEPADRHAGARAAAQAGERAPAGPGAVSADGQPGLVLRFGRVEGTRGALKGAPHFHHRRHRSDEAEVAVAHLPGGVHERLQGDPVQAAADAHAPHAGLAELVQRDLRIGESHHRVERLLQRRGHGAHFLQAVEPRRVEHVRAGGLEGLQAADGVVHVLPAVQEILGAGGQHERHRQGARHFDRRLHALDGKVEVVDRLLRVPGGILDGAAHRAGFAGKADRLGRLAGFVREAVLQVGIHRQARRLADFAAVVDHLFQRHVAHAQHVGDAEAGGCQRLEPHALEDQRRAAVPGIRNEEGPRARVQFPEYRRLARLLAHGRRL